MKYRICFGLFLLLLISHLSYSRIIETYSIRINSVCAGNDSLMVIPGVKFPLLTGEKISRISLLNYSYTQGLLQNVVFQIDQKNAQGRYVLSENDQDADKVIKHFSENDELVFRKKDLNKRINHSSLLLEQYSLIELEIIIDSSMSNSQSESLSASKWIYINLAPGKTEFNSGFNKLISYESEQDSITGLEYKIGFSKAHPFLLDSFYWRLPNQAGWTSDVTDTMKIRHLGKFFGLPFKRTQDDYFSQLIAVKEGPLRVIRRTENRIKVFWKLKSPALFIDYVMMPDGFVMDTMIDIPFKISFFFSDLATITTMDWNNLTDNTKLSVQATKSYPEIPINGLVSENKKAFNQITANRFSLTSNMGDFNVILDIPDDFPIQANLYLKDDLEALDPPENYPGQFGNIGFKTTGWENIGSQLYHLNFAVCVAAAN